MGAPTITNSLKERIARCREDRLVAVRGSLLSLFFNDFPHFLEDLHASGIPSHFLQEEAFDYGLALVIGDLAICDNNGLMHKYAKASQPSELQSAFSFEALSLLRVSLLLGDVANDGFKLG